MYHIICDGAELETDYASLLEAREAKCKYQRLFPTLHYEVCKVR